MHGLSRCLSFALFFGVILGGLALAAEPDASTAPDVTEKLVTFRDGTTVVLQLEGGFEIDERELAFGEVARAEFARVEPGSNLVEFLDITKGLGADRHPLREAASRRLEASMARFADLAQQYAERIEDPEIRIRLQDALATSDIIASTERSFDSLTLESVPKNMPNGAADKPASEASWDGDLGGWSATGRVSGVSIRLDRTKVERIETVSETAPRPRPLRVAGTGRAGKQGAFLQPLLEPKDRRGRIRFMGFEKDPDGKELKVGTNIERAFASWGCTFSTSVAGGKVVIDSYNVSAESGGVSAATDRPRWEGEITARFHQPGRPDQPATVMQAGCHVSSVVANGIVMKFFDAQGDLIGSVPATKNGVVMLGAISEVPIGSVRIVPNPAVDKNYAFDDFFFGELSSPDEQPARFGLMTTRGEVAFGDRLEAADGVWTLGGLSCGLERWRVAEKQVTKVVFNPGFRSVGAAALPALVGSGGAEKNIKLESLGAETEVLGFADGVLRVKRGGKEREIPVAEWNALVLR